MSTRTIQMTDALQAYLLRETVSEPPLLAKLRAETARLPEGEMQISPEQGQFMRLLVELTGARLALELGTFTGYSSICVASALPPEGRLICCDLSNEWTSVARRYWAAAGLAERIELRLGPALASLDALLSDPRCGKFDFMFIDADKLLNLEYYERGLKLLRPGGLIAIDNALRRGKVADPSIDEPQTIAVRETNQRICHDPRVTASLVPISDGVLLARKR